MSTTLAPASEAMPTGHEKMVKEDALDEETSLPENQYKQLRWVKEFGKNSLRDLTNHQGCDGKTFSVMPEMRPYVSDHYYPETLRTAKPPVGDFWVYDGAIPNLTKNGTFTTSIEQKLPPSRLHERDFIEWNRVGSKKGWMFHGRPQEDYDAPSGENKPTHTSDGFISRIKDTKWTPPIIDPALQRKAHHDLPMIDIENNARGIGTTGAGSGFGGMAGGYKRVNPERLKVLPIPKSKYNWTGSTVRSTNRQTTGTGGFRSGYNSQYGEFPAIIRRKTTGISYR